MTAEAGLGAGRDIEGRDSVGLYLDDITRYPLLDAAGEIELAKTIEAGLFAEQLLAEGQIGGGNGSAPGQATQEELEWLAAEGRLAVDTFVVSNLRLVVSIARKYSRSQMPLPDRIQEGNTGLFRAVEKFDYTKGYKFSTYASWWVRQAITRGIAQQARVVRLPVHIEEGIFQMGRARKTLERQLGREPEPEEIANELGVDVERVTDLIGWGKDHVSLDTPVDDAGKASLGDLIARDQAPGPDELAIDADTLERLQALLEVLDERSADILRLRNGLIYDKQHTRIEIGARHGISPERVRQIEREALDKLRRFADSDLNPESTGEAEPNTAAKPAVEPQATATTSAKSPKVTQSEPDKHTEIQDLAMHALTPAQQKLLRLLAEKTENEAAAELGITMRALRNRRTRLLNTLAAQYN